MTIVRADNLVKRYPKPGSKSDLFAAVDGVSLSIEAGEVYGILGPNGAGKTTTLEMLEGLSDIDAGDAFIDVIAAKTQQAIMLLGNLVTLPQIFLSGVFFSIDSMPEGLQPIASVLPLSFVVSGVRGVIIDGQSLLEQVPTVLGLVVWLAISLFLAIRMFVWKEVAT